MWLRIRVLQSVCGSICRIYLYGVADGTLIGTGFLYVVVVIEQVETFDDLLALLDFSRLDWRFFSLGMISGIEH